MSFRDDLLHQMARSIHVRQYPNEESNLYMNRLLYSSLACWIYTTVLDTLFEENYRKKGVSKSYITRRISAVLEQYLALYPAFAGYLEDRLPNEVIRDIRSAMEYAGFLIPTGFDEYLTLPPMRHVQISNALYLVKGLGKTTDVISIGVGLYSMRPECSSGIEWREMHYLPKMDALSWTKAYMETIQWGIGASPTTGLEYFDPLSQSTLSNSWRSVFPKNAVVTLYKRHDRDYGFAHRMPDAIKTVKIPEHLIGVESTENDNLFDNDVRRFMYGLKALHNNQARAAIEVDDAVCRLQLYNALPNREASALQFLGWRCKSLYNPYHTIIPLELLPVVKEMLLFLNINLEEVLHGSIRN